MLTVTSQQNGANYYDLPKHRKMLHYFHAFFRRRQNYAWNIAKKLR